MAASRFGTGLLFLLLRGAPLIFYLGLLCAVSSRAHTSVLCSCGSVVGPCTNTTIVGGDCCKPFLHHEGLYPFHTISALFYLVLNTL
jgi:hypothetical protein